MQTPEIVGFMLVRNEDLFVEQALTNVLDFCDRIIVLDNGSQDGTADILARLGTAHSKIEVRQAPDLARSHDPLEPMAGRDVWVLGVDGDELYDARGLRSVREKIMQGVYRDWWLLFGNVLNCTGIDWDTMV
jgi:glycosyltransferase involved in cell wall biosynthesis